MYFTNLGHYNILTSFNSKLAVYMHVGLKTARNYWLFLWLAGGRFATPIRSQSFRRVSSLVEGKDGQADTESYGNSDDAGLWYMYYTYWFFFARFTCACMWCLTVYYLLVHNCYLTYYYNKYVMLALFLSICKPVCVVYVTVRNSFAMPTTREQTTCTIHNYFYFYWVWVTFLCLCC